jgi:benzylsuccinate CoA-transferase BbsF subunit
VASPEDRIDHDVATKEWGLWPTVNHSAMGNVRVDGVPVHLSRTDWVIERGAPCLGEHNDYVYGDLLGIDVEERRSLKAEGVI